MAIELPPDLPEVQTDPALLDRVMANLVGNALRWSPPDRRVRVQAHSTGNDVQVHVIDHGPGIPVAQRAVVVGPLVPKYSLCVEQHGRISGKMIICASVYDREAYAWKASSCSTTSRASPPRRKNSAA